MRRISVAILLIAACSGDGSRMVIREDALSLTPPDDWQQSRERGTLMFTAEDVTIAVRSVPVDKGWIAPRTPALVLDSTRTVLGALPQARLGDPIPVEVDGFSAHEFSLTFVPSARTSRYERRHTVLVGRTRVVHVFLTGQEGTTAAAVPAYQAVVRSIREEG